MRIQIEAHIMEKQSCVSVSRDFLDVFALTRKTNKTYF